MPPRKTTRTSRSKNYRTGTSTWTPANTHRGTGTYYPCNSPKFNTARGECEWRMGSYRNVWSQFNGAGAKTSFSPTTASKWMKYINNGVRVYKFTSTDFSRHFGSQWTEGSVTATRQYLKKKYGAAIKDITRGKGNCWLIATTKSVTGRPFTNYTWK